MSITDLISTVGFPIACVIALGWFVVTQLNAHKEEMQQVTQALNNNTIVLNKILEHIREGERNDRL